MSTLPVPARAGGAATSPPAGSTREPRQFLCFSTAGSTYAAAIADVKEIIQYTPLTEVPMMPAHLRGVLNLRGSVVPVVDLAVRFGQPPAEVGKRTCVIILELQDEGRSLDIGVLVDSVSEVIEIPDSEMAIAPSFGANVRADFICGMVKREKGFIIVLDVSKTFEIAEIAALADAPATMAN